MTRAILICLTVMVTLLAVSPAHSPLVLGMDRLVGSSLLSTAEEYCQGRRSQRNIEQEGNRENRGV